jgi:hypothetical protein
MLTKRVLIIAGLVCLPLIAGGCATNDSARSGEASVGSSSQGTRGGNVQTARGTQGFRTNNERFDYPNY